MPRYSVQLPVTGYIMVDVEAENEAAAIDAALDVEGLTNDMIEEWEIHRQTNRGNVAYGSCTEANAELIED